MRWDKKDIPHKGWTEIGMEDLGRSGNWRRYGNTNSVKCGNRENTICAYYDIQNSKEN